MTDFIEFQAKTLDDAINDACDYFNAEREKLEIEILEDAKSGVFGLIGTRNAKIQARKANLDDFNAASVFSRKEIIPREEQSQKPAKPEKAPKEAKKAKEEKSQKPKAEKAVKQEKPAKSKPKAKDDEDFAPKKERFERVPRENEPSLSELDQELLLSTSKNVVTTLIKDIDAEAKIEADVYDERVNLRIDSDDSGLLIGKEGQCLASLEYIAARIISKELDFYVRIQIEVGDYKSRQAERLHDFALSLADRVMATGKSASTKPLSAYQRRIIHMALQDMSEIQTRSIGEGSSKRVVISRAKGQRA